MTRTAATLALAAASTAHADGTATWLWDVTTQDGDAVVEPGETASVTLSLLMEVNPGDGPFVAIAAADFNTLGMENAANGHILGWEIENNLDFHGDETTTDGVSLFGTVAFQLTTDVFTSDNPVDVLTFEWQPDAAGEYAVNYMTDTEVESGQFVSVWEGKDKESSVAVLYPVTEAPITFSVVPAPAAALALLPVAAPRRRRDFEL